MTPAPSGGKRGRIGGSAPYGPRSFGGEEWGFAPLPLKRAGWVQKILALRQA